jgi:Domain of unknown function (DUF4136)
MGRLTLIVPVLAAAAALAGCAGIRVRTDQNSQLLANVHCQSVAWAGGFKGAGPLRDTIANPLNEARLRDAIAADLQTAGISLVEAPKAQCLVGYGIGMERQLDTVYPDGWDYGYGGGYWGRRWGPGWGWDEPYIYHQSFITVDLYDAASKQPIWHASAEQSLSGLTGDAASQRIRAAVNAIFLKLPH